MESVNSEKLPGFFGRNTHRSHPINGCWTRGILIEDELARFIVLEHPPVQINRRVFDMGSFNLEKLLGFFGRNTHRCHPINKRVSRKILVADALAGFFGPDQPPVQFNRWVFDMGIVISEKLP